MSKIIGFAGLDHLWEDPVTLEFHCFREHTKTVRYRCQLERHVFDLYAPRFLLSEATGEEAPEQILVMIGMTKQQFQGIGFHGVSKSREKEPGLLHYRFAEDKANSKRYDVTYDGQQYSLYVPNEVFGDNAPPSELFLRIDVPA